MNRAADDQVAGPVPDGLGGCGGTALIHARVAGATDPRHDDPGGCWRNAVAFDAGRAQGRRVRLRVQADLPLLEYTRRVLSETLRLYPPAWLLGRPLLLQEQNSIPGLANRWLARVADEVHLSFTEARAYFKRKDNLKVTGNPVRAHILGGDRGQALQAFDLDEGRPTLFIFGGSRGAHRINEAALDAMRRLKGRVDLQFILQTGREDYEWAKAQVDAEQLPARVMAFLRDIHLAYAVADLVVCRSGAMTLAEIAACGTPAILVPYPHAAHNHQEVNAHNLVERGAAALVLDRELTGERLAKEIAHLVADRQTLRRMSANARTFARLDAAERIVRSLERSARGRGAVQETPAGNGGGR